MNSLLLAILGLAFTANTLADETATKEFQQRAEALGRSISSDNAIQSERCAELRRQVEAARAKPQRLSTARQAYQEECTRDYTEPVSPGLSIGR